MARKKSFERDQVVNKALQLFWRNGYLGTPIQDLVEQLLISRSSLYDTFGDKYNLYIETLERYHIEYFDRYFHKDFQQHSPCQRLKVVLSGIVNDLLNDPSLKGCLMVNAGIEAGSNDKKIRKIVGKFEERMRNELRDLIAHAKLNLEIRPDISVWKTAIIFSNMIIAIKVLSKTSPDRQIFEGATNYLMALLDQ